MRIVLILFMSLLLVPEAASQIYAGASIGNAFINKDLEDVEGLDFQIDTNSFTYRLFAGVGGGLLGAEGGYRDLGTVERTVGNTEVALKSTGWDGAAKAQLSIGPLIAFGKAGLFFGKDDATITDTQSDRFTSFFWGLGAGMRLGLIGFRIEYESLDLSSDNKLAVVSAGATLHLGG